jgi:hypothetical protein
MKGAGHKAYMVKTVNAFRILAGKPKEKIQLGKPKCADNNIEMDLREIRMMDIN